MKNLLPALTLAALFSFTGHAQASINLNFDFLNGVHGVQPNNPQVFSAEGAGNSGYTISAYGFTENNSGTTTTPTSLYVKTSSDPSEQGLGLTNDTADHEIQPLSLIRVDFSALKSQLQLGQAAFQITSVQQGEGFEIFASNSSTPTSTSKVTLLASETNTTNHSSIYTETISAGDLSRYPYFFVTATSPNGGHSDILLSNITVAGNAVPEPGSVALLGIGIVGIFAVAARRRRSDIPA